MQIEVQAWPINAHDPKGLRAAAAAHLISACGKHELSSITKTQVFGLHAKSEFDTFAAATIKESAIESPCAQMLRALHVPPNCVLGPLPFATFERLLTGELDQTYARRHTYIVIVVVPPLASADAAEAAGSTPLGPLPSRVPDCPRSGVPPWADLFAGTDFQVDDAEAEAEAEELPRVQQPHHFVVAWRREADSLHAQRLSAESDFRRHGQPSPVVHQAAGSSHTPGMPPGGSFDVPFHPM